MLYSLLICNVVLALLCPIVAILAFIKGYNLNAIKHDEKPITAPRMHVKEPKGDARMEQLLANIDAYDGTGKGQREIV